MQFVLAGFRQVENIRRYYFDAMGDDGQRHRFEVGADLRLAQRYKVPIQELPLLCRRLLEGCSRLNKTMFTEDDMSRYAEQRTAAEDASLAKRRAHRPPPSNRVGQAWRDVPAPETKR